MIACLCGCPDLDHALGEGICSCGCGHTLTSEVVVLGDAGEVWIDLPDLPAAVCPHGDPTCPCPDGLACHYQGADPMRCPTTGIVGCTACRMTEGLADAMGEEEA